MCVWGVVVVSATSWGPRGRFRVFVPVPCVSSGLWRSVTHDLAPLGWVRAWEHPLDDSSWPWLSLVSDNSDEIPIWLWLGCFIQWLWVLRSFTLVMSRTPLLDSWVLLHWKQRQLSKGSLRVCLCQTVLEPPGRGTCLSTQYRHLGINFLLFIFTGLQNRTSVLLCVLRFI